MTLVVLWNVGTLLLAIASKNEYDLCMAEEGFNLCFDFSGRSSSSWWRWMRWLR
jgi:hypothetical protein